MGLITEGIESKKQLATKEEIDELKLTYLIYPDGMMYEHPDYEGKPIPLRKIQPEDEDDGAV